MSPDLEGINEPDVAPSIAITPNVGGEEPDVGKTYYAWSTFPLENDEQTGFVTKWLTEGEVVTPKKLNITQEQFDELVLAGSVRSTKYPVPAGAPESPAEWHKKELARLATEAGE